MEIEKRRTSLAATLDTPLVIVVQPAVPPQAIAPAAELPIREQAIDQVAELATRQQRDRLVLARIVLAIRASGAVLVPVAPVQVLVPKAAALVAVEVPAPRAQVVRVAEVAWAAAGSAGAEAAIAAGAEEDDGDN